MNPAGKPDKYAIRLAGAALLALFISIPGRTTSLLASQEVEFGPGDVRAGYESKHYETRSTSLQKRIGKAADLAGMMRSPPLGLPEVPVPPDNPVTEEKVLLGRKLFFDRRLSFNGTMSCAMCHVPEQGFTNNELATPVGHQGRTVRRNAPTIYNTAYYSTMFHDGRDSSLEFQIWGPLLAQDEMANPSIGSVVEKIRNLPGYKDLFQTAFAGRSVSIETIGMAIASYERTLISGNSPFDRYYFGDDQSAIGAAAKRGLDLFTGKARCSTCHLISKSYALFTDNTFHNTGIGWKSPNPGTTSYSVQLAPGVSVQLTDKVIETVAEPPPPDLGRYEVTQAPSDRWSYKTPSLRNVALTAPYMHNGELNTLQKVLSFYNQGGRPNPSLDQSIVPLGLSAEEMDDLVSFLNSLTGDNVKILVMDAFAAPVGDVTESPDALPEPSTSPDTPVPE